MSDPDVSLQPGEARRVGRLAGCQGARSIELARQQAEGQTPAPEAAP